MIEYIENRDLFESHAEVLVNTVNCKGVMGKGIALEFKHRFPDCYPKYKKSCHGGSLKPGGIIYIDRRDLFNNKDIAHFATKNHWRGKSELQWIDSGLGILIDELSKRHIRSVAMPALGCGLGGLNWNDVKPLVEKYFKYSDIKAEVYLSATKEFGEI